MLSITSIWKGLTAQHMTPGLKLVIIEHMIDIEMAGRPKDDQFSDTYSAMLSETQALVKAEMSR